MSKAREAALSAGAVATAARIDLELARTFLDLAMLDRAAESIAHALGACRRFGLSLLPHVFIAQAMLGALETDSRRVEAAIAAAAEAGPTACG